MGLLVTVKLIAWNVYGSTKAPPSRGFSYIEMWITGIQCNIVLAIVEYACILALSRVHHEFLFLIFGKNYTMDKIVKIIDFTSLLVSLTFFFLFNVFYWTSAMK